MEHSSDRGHALEASASTLWTILFMAYSSSTFVSEFGHGWVALWTILLVLTPVVLAGLPNVLDQRRHSVPILVSYVLYVIVPAMLQLCKPDDVRTTRAQLFDVATVLVIWLPLEFKLLSKNISPTGKVTVWGLLTAALNILNTFTVLRPLSRHEFARELGYSFKLSASDVVVSLLFSALYVAAVVPLATATKFAKVRSRLSLRQRPQRELAAFFGMYMSALTEELLFRGLIQNMLEQQTSKNSVLALIGGAFAYAVAHISKSKLGFSSPNYRFALCAFVSGLVCGITWRVTSKVTASGITHVVADYLLYRVLFTKAEQA